MLGFELGFMYKDKDSDFWVCVKDYGLFVNEYYDVAKDDTWELAKGYDYERLLDFGTDNFEKIKYIESIECVSKEF